MRHRWTVFSVREFGASPSLSIRRRRIVQNSVQFFAARS
jgi:hypothetical protein